MNPYSPELNYFLAYQYCRSLGLQLASFETKEKADTMTQYLKNAGYTKYDFWTSGNKLGTDMFLWMSTGLPFNVTFDYMLKRPGNRPADVPPGTEPQRVARERYLQLSIQDPLLTLGRRHRAVSNCFSFIIRDLTRKFISSYNQSDLVEPRLCIVVIDYRCIIKDL